MVLFSVWDGVIFSVKLPSQPDLDFSSCFCVDGFDFSASSFLMFFIPCDLVLCFSWDVVCDLFEFLLFHFLIAMITTKLNTRKPPVTARYRLSICVTNCQPCQAVSTGKSGR